MRKNFFRNEITTGDTLISDLRTQILTTNTNACKAQALYPRVFRSWIRVPKRDRVFGKTDISLNGIKKLVPWYCVRVLRSCVKLNSRIACIFHKIATTTTATKNKDGLNERRHTNWQRHSWNGIFWNRILNIVLYYALYTNLCGKSIVVYGLFFCFERISSMRFARSHRCNKRIWMHISLQSGQWAIGFCFDMGDAYAPNSQFASTKMDNNIQFPCQKPDEAVNQDTFAIFSSCFNILISIANHLNHWKNCFVDIACMDY